MTDVHNVIWGYCEEPAKSPNTLMKIVESYFLVASYSSKYC